MCFTIKGICMLNSKVQRWAARYVKNVYAYYVSVTINELKWESLESLRREQLSLTILYNVLKQNIYLPPECIPKFYQRASQYQLQTRSYDTFRLVEPFCDTDTSSTLYSFTINISVRDMELVASLHPWIGHNFNQLYGTVIMKSIVVLYIIFCV